MRPADVVSLAGGALGRQRRRTLLSLLGLAIGVASVVVLTALGQGARNYVSAQFEVLGTRVLAVVPGKVETTGGIPGLGGVPNDMTLADAEALLRTLRGVERVVPMTMGNDTISSDGLSRATVVIGTTAGYRELRDITVRGGSFLPQGPMDRGDAVAVLGARVARELFPGQDALGSSIRVGAWRMRVIGTLESQGMHFGVDMDELVLVPVATAMRMFDVSSLFRIAVEVRPGIDLARAEREVLAILTERHGEEDVTVTTPEAVIDSLQAVLGMLTLALVGIAAISLAVAGIGIMNVMLVAVSERRSEIGLLKALGAERRQVLALFVTEAGLLSAAGGVVGVIFGWGLVRLLVWRYPAFPATPPPWAVAAALAVALLTGVVFGWLPARRAVRLDPVDALTGRTR